MIARQAHTAAATAAGAAITVAAAALTLLTPAFTDYELEVEPSLTHLLRGDLVGFFGTLPAYGGSVLMRAPAAIVTHGLGGGDLAVFRAMAVPCLLAALALGVVLWRGLGGRSGRRWAPWVALAVVVANPVVLPALETGHPEEILGAALCAGAVLAALRDSPGWAGALLGLALANKAWAVIAILPVLMATPRRGLTSGVAATVTATVLVPVLALGSAFSHVTAVGRSSGQIFQPWQLWWFTGDHGKLVQGVYGVKAGYRAGPEWLGSVAHPLLIGAVLAFALMCAIRGGRDRALLVLAACLLLRCVLDPWNTAYYSVPFLFALAAHEAVVARRAPVGAAAASVAVYGTEVLARSLSPDLQAGLYLAWALPLAVVLSSCALELRLGRRLADQTGHILGTRLPTLKLVLGPRPVPHIQTGRGCTNPLPPVVPCPDRSRH